MSEDSDTEDPTSGCSITDDTGPCDVVQRSTTAEESSGSAEERMRQSDELACKLAYECGWRLCGDALQTLESQRTRAFTLLSVTLVAAGIAATGFLRGDGVERLGSVGLLGLVVFAVGALIVMVCTARVAWPLVTDAALRPSVIVANYVTPRHEDRRTTWVHQYLARDLENAYDKMCKKLAVRNMFYKWSIASAPVVLFGAAMLVLDVIVG